MLEVNRLNLIVHTVTRLRIRYQTIFSLTLVWLTINAT